MGREILGFLSRDSRGFALSLDLLLAIIPITLLLGFVAADMDNLLYNMEDAVFRSSMDRTAGDAVNTLLETSGNPYNWETTGNATIVGLAQYDTSKNAPIEGTIDPIKLSSLTQGQVQNLTGSNYNFYLEVSTINKTGTPSSLKTLGNNSYSSAPDVVKVEKDVLASKSKIVSSQVGQIRYTGGPITFTMPPFQTSFNSNQSYDYWILIVNNAGFTSATVSVNNNAINFPSATNMTQASMISSNYLNLNASTPNNFYNNTVTLNATGTFGSSMDIYIIQAPKNVTPPEINYNTVVPRNSKLDFYLWLK